MTTINSADTVHVATKTICQYLLDRADELKMLPSARRDLTAVCADTTPRYFNYITFGEVDDRGYERTKVTLRLDFERLGALEGPGRVVDDDGAVYWTKRLQVHVESSQLMLRPENARTYIAHYSAVVAAAADIERQYDRDLYILLATAQEAREQEEQRRRSQLSHLIATEVSGLRVGQSRQVLCDVADKLPGISWPSMFLGIETRDRGKVTRTYDVSVGNVGVMVTRTK
jgi:hypothetical protein